MSGEKGDIGPLGSKGPAGAPGDQGLPGVEGAIGPRGNPGILSTKYYILRLSDQVTIPYLPYIDSSKSNMNR